MLVKHDFREEISGFREVLVLDSPYGIFEGGILQQVKGAKYMTALVNLGNDNKRSLFIIGRDEKELEKNGLALLDLVHTQRIPSLPYDKKRGAAIVLN